MFNVVRQWHPLRLAEDFAIADISRRPQALRRRPGDGASRGRGPRHRGRQRRQRQSRRCRRPQPGAVRGVGRRHARRLRRRDVLPPRELFVRAAARHPRSWRLRRDAHAGARPARPGRGLPARHLPAHTSSECPSGASGVSGWPTGPSSASAWALRRDVRGDRTARCSPPGPSGCWWSNVRDADTHEEARGRRPPVATTSSGSSSAPYGCSRGYKGAEAVGETGADPDARGVGRAGDVVVGHGRRRGRGPRPVPVDCSSSRTWSCSPSARSATRDASTDDQLQRLATEREAGPDSDHHHARRGRPARRIGPSTSAWPRHASPRSSPPPGRPRRRRAPRPHRPGSSCRPRSSPTPTSTRPSPRPGRRTPTPTS